MINPKVIPNNTNWFTVVTASRQSLFSGKKATEVATTKLGPDLLNFLFSHILLH
jgi:hypothetical protein